MLSDVRQDGVLLVGELWSLRSHHIDQEAGP